MTDTAAQKKLATRERLIVTAAALFQQRGYHAIGVAEILNEAQIPRGSLYHHFPGGKANLALAAVEWLTAEILNAIRNLRLAYRHADLEDERPVKLLERLRRPNHDKGRTRDRQRHNRRTHQYRVGSVIVCL